jgi:hypothetical protein
VNLVATRITKQNVKTYDELPNDKVDLETMRLV